MDIKVKSHLKPCAAVSIAIMIVALVMTLTGHGMNLGVHFTGRRHHDLQHGRAV